jgi:hypothetical protein
VRTHDPFKPADLRELDDFYCRAQVVAMEDIYDAREDYWRKSVRHVIGLRHDCDNVIVPAVEMAGWEAERGYRSTYYILHTAPYWQDKGNLRDALDAIAMDGHEIGIHNDAITVALETRRSPADVLHEAIDELRGYGHTIRSTVAHGNRRCHIDGYVNDEMFTECYRPDYGDLSRLELEPVSLAEFGLDFDANWLPRGDYLSDSGGVWSQRFEDVAAAWPSKGQLHMLIHPDWWQHAFTPEKATV